MQPTAIVVDFIHLPADHEAGARGRRGARRKSFRRRVARELRALAPMFGLAATTVLLFGTVAVVDYTPALRSAGLMPGDFAQRGIYSLTTAISSTSKVRAAPPGIDGGAPLSP
jgi:hypothetical protein